MDEDLIEFTSCLQRLSNRLETELEDEYEPVVEQFKEYSLEIIRKSVHPLEQILERKNNNHNGSYILASLHVEPTASRENSMNKDGDNSHCSEIEIEESVEGSPLKLQEFQRGPSLTTSPSGSLLKPVTLESARYFVSLYNLVCDDLTKDCLPLWVLCDGHNKQGVVAMASTITNKETSHVIDAHIVTVTGPVTESENLPNFRDILKKHSFAHCGKNVSMRCHADFNLFGTPSREDSGIAIGQGSLGVKLDWDKTTDLLQTPPLDAKASVYATVEAGDMRSAAYCLYKELATLFGIAQGLEAGVVSWTPSKELEDLPMLTKMQILIEELKLGDTVRKSTNEEDEQLLSPLNSLVLGNRKDLDFTEQLWKVLRECKSYQELTDSLQLVFKSLQSGDFQPMVHKSNKSKFAELVRESYFKTLTMPSLDGTVPLELLVGIGIEKMQRDYAHAFIGKDLVTASHLQYYLPEEAGLLEKLNRLEKLHHALELVVMLEQFLGLPRITLASSAMRALTHYEKHNADEEHTFNIPVQTTFVARLIDKCMPLIWRADLASQDSDRDVHTVCVVTSKPPLPHVHHKETDTEETEDAERDTTADLYLTVVTQDIMVL